MRSSGDRRVTGRRRGRRNEDAGGATRTHSTLSAETTHVRVFYPFHPLYNFTLRVIRRPKRGDGAASVLDLTGRRLKIPLWMLSPDSAEIKITERAHLSREALLSLALLLAQLLDTEGRTHDNLLQTDLEASKGGHRAATTTCGPNPNGRAKGVHRRNGSNRTGRSHGPDSGGGLSSRRRETQ
jgi:hypothetical protein